MNVVLVTLTVIGVVAVVAIVLFVLLMCAGRMFFWASGWPDGDPVWERITWDIRHPEDREKGWWRGKLY